MNHGDVCSYVIKRWKRLLIWSFHVKQFGNLLAEWTATELLDIQPNQFGDARGRLRRVSSPPAILFGCVVLVSLFFYF
jgi:hypothetical protein